MLSLFLTIVGNAFGLWVTTVLVPGIGFRGGLGTLLVAGLLWGLFRLAAVPLGMPARNGLAVAAMRSSTATAGTWTATASTVRSTLL